MKVNPTFLGNFNTKYLKRHLISGILILAACKHFGLCKYWISWFSTKFTLAQNYDRRKKELYQIKMAVFVFLSINIKLFWLEREKVCHRWMREYLHRSVLSWPHYVISVKAKKNRGCLNSRYENQCYFGGTKFSQIRKIQKILYSRNLISLTLIKLFFPRTGENLQPLREYLRLFYLLAKLRLPQVKWS